MSLHARDFLLALAFIAIGIVALVVLANTTGEPRISGAGVLTFATLPSAYAGMLMALSALLGFNALRAQRRARAAGGLTRGSARPSGEDDAEGPSRKAILARTGVTLVILIAYALLLDYVNFMVLTTVFLAVLFVVLGQRSWWRIGLIALCGGAGFYALFIWALDLPV